MIGGQVIIPIRNANNEKFTVTSTATVLKAGTYDKIVRAIALQKELVLEDLVVNLGSNLTINAASHSAAYSIGLDTTKSVRVIVYYYTPDATPTSATIKVTNENKIIYVAQ